MREYCKTKDCRRQFINDYFGFKQTKDEHGNVIADEYGEGIVPHACCDNCKKKCNCGQCDDEPEEQAESLSKEPEEVQQRAEALLTRYFDAENKCCGMLAELKTGLSVPFAEYLASNASVYCDIDMLQLKYGYLKDTYLANIAKILWAAVVRYPPAE